MNPNFLPRSLLRVSKLSKQSTANQSAAAAVYKRLDQEAQNIKKVCWPLLLMFQQFHKNGVITLAFLKIKYFQSIG